VRTRKYAKLNLPKVEEISKPEVTYPSPQVDDKIVIHFNQPVEIYINQEPYIGVDIEAPSYTVAAEIVRIAREAYGQDII